MLEEISLGKHNEDSCVKFEKSFKRQNKKTFKCQFRGNMKKISDLIVRLEPKDFSPDVPTTNATINYLDRRAVDLQKIQDNSQLVLIASKLKKNLMNL